MYNYGGKKMKLYERWLADIEIMDKNLKIIKRAGDTKTKTNPKQEKIKKKDKRNNNTEKCNN